MTQQGNQPSWVYILFIVISLVILVDYLIPGQEHTAAIERVKTEVQNHSSASGESHNSYRLYTQEIDFSVSDEFARNAKKGEEVHYELSVLFQEVNAYSLSETNNSETYSLRQFSGLIFPLFAIAAMILGMRNKGKYGILFFIVQALVIGNLAFLFG
ncbi:MAG: hypothetical protein MK081_10545 [Flavobacteriales bacterium]|nr:hypothetical protein [Flavobacteriales bacterium]